MTDRPGRGEGYIISTWPGPAQRGARPYRFPEAESEAERAPDERHGHGAGGAPHRDRALFPASALRPLPAAAVAPLSLRYAPIEPVLSLDAHAHVHAWRC